MIITFIKRTAVASAYGIILIGPPWETDAEVAHFDTLAFSQMIWRILS